MDDRALIAQPCTLPCRHKATLAAAAFAQLIPHHADTCFRASGHGQAGMHHHMHNLCEWPSLFGTPLCTSPQSLVCRLAAALAKESHMCRIALQECSVTVLLLKAMRIATATTPRGTREDTAQAHGDTLQPAAATNVACSLDASTSAPAAHSEQQPPEEQEQTISTGNGGNHSSACNKSSAVMPAPRGLAQLAAGPTGAATNTKYLLAGVALAFGATKVDRSSPARAYESTKRIHSVRPLRPDNVGNDSARQFIRP